MSSRRKAGEVRPSVLTLALNIYCRLPCAPRTSRPGRAPVALPPRCVTTPETMVAS